MKALRLIVAIVLSAAFLLGQQTKDPPEREPSERNPPERSRPDPSEPDNDSVKPQRAAGPPRELALIGNVALSNGTPPPVDTPIELVCLGGQPAEAVTDADGDYRFHLVESRGIDGGVWTADRSIRVSARAGIDPRMGDAGCKLRVLLNGYRAVREGSTRVQGGIIREINLGKVILYPLEEARSTTVSVTTLNAPPEAAEKHREGLRALSADPPDIGAAVDLLQQATILHPSYAEAWTDLGLAHILKRSYPAARVALEEAREADSSYLPLYPRLTAVYVELQEWPAAAETAAAWERLAPGSQAAAYYRAMTAMNSGDYAAAEAASLQVLAGPDLEKYPYVLYFLGFIEAQRGDLESAAGRFRQLLEIRPDAPMAAEVRSRLDEWRAAERIDPQRLAGRL